MTVLRRKMIEDMQLRGLSSNTQKAYTRVVSELAIHYNKPPDLYLPPKSRPRNGKR